MGPNDDLFCGFEALTFDDVLVVPGYSDLVPGDADVSTSVAGIDLSVPILSAAMDTVTESPLATAMAREGGLGVIHRNLDIDDQAAQVAAVKRAQSGLITDPISLDPSATVAEAEELMARDRISGVPITGAGGRLVGILTNRDIRFVTGDEWREPVSAHMTPADRLVTAPVGTSLETARAILHRERIEKLPLVDDEGRLRGLITVKDIIKRVQKPDASLDDDGRLRVGAAVGVNDTKARVDALVEAGVDVVVVDTAHGHSAGVIGAVADVRAGWPDVRVVAGNVVTRQGVAALADAGADVIKVGVGAGSICTTRLVAGAGVPQLSAIHECAVEASRHGVGVIADGGIVTPGDVVKALVAGAHAVMVGNLLAGTDEAPGDVELIEGAMWKVYRGMGSSVAMRGRASDRYASGRVAGASGTGASGTRAAVDGGAGAIRDAAKVVPEGVEGRVRYAGPLAELVGQLVGGLRSGMGYAGARDLDALGERTRLVRISGAGLRESHPHDVHVTRDGYAR